MTEESTLFEVTYRQIWKEAMEKFGPFNHLSKPQIDAIAADCRRKTKERMGGDRD